MHGTLLYVLAHPCHMLSVRSFQVHKDVCMRKCAADGMRS